MIYTNRFKQILQIVLEQGDAYIPVDELARRLNISRRTVFRELQNANLKPYHLDMVSRQGRGIRIEGDEKDRRRLAADIATDLIPYVSKEERRKLLAFELLRFPDVKKLVVYGNMFSVSETTISNDLDALASWFEHYHIELNRAHKNNIRLLGKEEDRRLAMSAIIHDTIGSKEQAIDYLDADALRHEVFEASQDGILRLLNQDILDPVLDLFTLERHELGLNQYAQSSYIGLIIHLVVAVERIQKGEAIESDPSLCETMRATPAMEQAKAIAGRLESIFDIEIPQAETVFIAMHLSGAKNVDPIDAFDDDQIVEIANDFMNDFPPRIASSLRMDPRFIKGFITHLRPTLIRLQRGLPIYNPLLETIQAQYGELYAQSAHAAALIGEKTGLSISEAEIAFMTMHVGASLERRRFEARQARIHTAIVCASGVGVSALLAARLQHVFGTRLHLVTLSLEQYKTNAYDDLDLIISTFDLAQGMVPVVKVNPLLTQNDIDHLRDVMKNLEYGAHADPDRDGLEKLRRVEQMTGAARAIVNGLVFANVDPALDWPALVAEAGLLADGSASEVTSALLEREKIGSVMVPELGFGLLHAKTTGVKNAQVQFLWPAQAQEFAAYPGIRAVVVLLMPADYASYHQKLLSSVTTYMMETTNLQQAVFEREERRIQQALSAIYLELIRADMA